MPHDDPSFRGLEVGKDSEGWFRIKVGTIPRIIYGHFHVPPAEVGSREFDALQVRLLASPCRRMLQRDELQLWILHRSAVDCETEIA